MAQFAGRVSLTNGTWLDLFNGLANTGKYQVTFTQGTSNTRLTTDNTATEGVDLGMTMPFSFTWDSADPLYVYANGSGLAVRYILTPLASVGLSVSC